MQSSPSKFTEIFEDYRPAHPWARALASGNFEMIDHITLRQQLKLIKGVYAKQLILEGLLVPAQQTESGSSYSGVGMAKLIKQWTEDQLKATPSKIHMNKAQYDIAKKFADSEAAKQKLKANLQKAAR
jgi:protoheme ferro-lyase